MGIELPKHFLSYENFEFAFTRIVRGSNKEYKSFYRHLFSSYNLSLKENLQDLIDDIKRGTYVPCKPTVIFHPKKSGVLRPLTLLSLMDLIVYQAIVNRIAVAFEREQDRFAYKKSFGAIFAGRNSNFFYRSWKASYQKYNDAICKAFEAGNDYVADFDLVSFYELIEHDLLRGRLKRRVKNEGLLSLLVKCLGAWTSDKAGASVGHGIPQGPEPSAFLAECILFHFDAENYRNVKYARYIDDIRLMAKGESTIRRALLRLDLQSKELGLVPQAQKIECRKVKDVEELLNNVPSELAGPGLRKSKTSHRVRKTSFQRFAGA
jgi:retron-type reverse transcriptase